MNAFWVKDKYGQFRDILVGFDNLVRSLTPSPCFLELKCAVQTNYESGRNFFAPVVGRYANRIRNGTFTIPISKDASGPGEKYQVPENEHNGAYFVPFVQESVLRPRL